MVGDYRFRAENNMSPRHLKRQYDEDVEQGERYAKDEERLREIMGNDEAYDYVMRESDENEAKALDELEYLRQQPQEEDRAWPANRIAELEGIVDSIRKRRIRNGGIRADLTADSERYPPKPMPKGLFDKPGPAPEPKELEGVGPRWK